MSGGFADQPSQRVNLIVKRVDGRLYDNGAAKMDRAVARPLSGGVDLLIQKAA